MFKNKTNFKKAITERLLVKYGKELKECSEKQIYEALGEMTREYATAAWKKSNDYIKDNKEKELVYFSMEFLMGRLLTSNLVNLGAYQVAKKGLEELGFDINRIEDQEADAGLGNGGLGRLAACFLDSIAALSYPGHGHCLRYEFGFFKQKIVYNKQVEVPDQWLTHQTVWEVKKPEEAVKVHFYGYDETYQDDAGNIRWRNAGGVCVRAVPYDVPVIGYKNDVVNTLRLWSSEPDTDNLPSNQSFDQYLNETREICLSLYPDDSTEHGKLLRLRQQYFLVSAGLQSTFREHKKRYGTLKNVHEKHVFQLNDTHPILSIPETMRILMDEENFSWDDAWAEVTKMMAYTNHTIMAEALEKWPVSYMSRLLPRIYNIVEEIDRRLCNDLRAKGYDEGFIYRVRIIKDNNVNMANLGIHAGFSVNGVAKLHTDICINDTFRDFYHLYPNKFNNKTNGITHRRWFNNCNPELADYITSLIGDSWITNPSDLEKLMEFVDDKKVLRKIVKIKENNKVRFANFVKEHNGIEVDTKSIFDTQVKRLHAYKRQLMNIFRIMYFYKRMKAEPTFRIHPRTFFFGAKSAPSYSFAKNVIELINCVSDVINNDPEISKYMKIVFIENYGVSAAEVIIPGSDVSEQISTAGKEASGTSNMKFMINGAITLGTLDGANVEINALVGDEHSVIFGLKDYELDDIRRNNSYRSWDVYNNNYWLRQVIDSLVDGSWHWDRNEFRQIFDEIMWKNDEYFNLLDFDSYIAATLRTDHMYKNKLEWAKSCLINIAKSGYFSSDRTIEQYVEDIWHLNKIDYTK